MSVPVGIAGVAVPPGSVGVDSVGNGAPALTAIRLDVRMSPVSWINLRSSVVPRLKLLKRSGGSSGGWEARTKLTGTTASTANWIFC